MASNEGRVFKWMARRLAFFIVVFPAVQGTLQAQNFEPDPPVSEDTTFGFVPNPGTAKNSDFVFERFRDEKNEDFGYFVTAAKWARSTDLTTRIKVCWENYKQEFSREHKLVQDAITESWQRQSQVRFWGWRSCEPDSEGVRIYVADDADAGPHVKQLGRKLSGIKRGMVLDFTFLNWGKECAYTKDACIKSIAIHEFGHALGFAHEHDRHDRPGECEEPSNPEPGAKYLTPYDIHSVMNYCNPKYNNDGILSKRDLISLHAIYGKNESSNAKNG